MKKCTKCGVEKPTTDFYKQTAAKDGLRYRCKKCYAEIIARHDAENPDAALARLANAIEYLKKFQKSS